SLFRAVQPEEGQNAPSRRPGMLLLRLRDSAMRFLSPNDLRAESIFLGGSLNFGGIGMARKNESPVIVESRSA
ncbi:hypothetical protein Lcin_3213, partial [Legionella cincinnatiensis]